jgi:hypothetical protein
MVGSGPPSALSNSRSCLNSDNLERGPSAVTQDVTPASGCLRDTGVTVYSSALRAPDHIQRLKGNVE